MNKRSNMNSVTIATVLADAKKQGLNVRKSASTVNGQAAYRIEGKPGLCTKQGLMEIVGLYA